MTDRDPAARAAATGPVEARAAAPPRSRKCPCLAENNPGASWCAACGGELAEPTSAAELVYRLPVIEYQIPIGPGGLMVWRQTRRDQTRTWQPWVGWSQWTAGLVDDLESVDRVNGGAPARIVAADFANGDPFARRRT